MRDLDLSEQDYTRLLVFTLGELVSGLYLYEASAEIRSAIGDARTDAMADDERAALTQRLLRDLWRGGWAQFVRYSPSAVVNRAGTVLDDEEVEAVIEGCVWMTDPAEGDALHVELERTEKTLTWWKSQQMGFRGDRLPPVMPD